MTEDLKINVAVLSEKLDNICYLLEKSFKEQKNFNKEIDDRVYCLELTQEKWRGYWVGGLAVVTAIFSLITLVIKYYG